MGSDRLYEMLAEAKSRPSGAYRALEAALNAGERTIGGYERGLDIEDKLRKRKSAQQTLSQALGGKTLPGAESFSDLSVENLQAIGPSLRGMSEFATKQESQREPRSLEEILAMKVQRGEMTVDDAAKVKRSFSPSSLPTMPRPMDPLDRQIKEAQLAKEKRGAGSEKSINDAYTLWKKARAGLVSGLEGTVTGPIVGRMPALTANQQIAKGSVSAVAPVLKQLFRVAGEGVFTDRDQQILIDMIPTRSVLPAARDAMLQNIDNIVKAKLGIGEENQESGSGDPEAEAAIERVMGSDAPENKKQAAIAAIRARSER